jgi:hypothetical protein|tara:strand:+ start:26 stop:397 length:372 start_codon:yes stop_codon:yes gene_type:complete
MSSSNIVLTNKNELTYTSDAVKGDGYYGFADGLHTMSFHVTNFTGRIHLEATIVETPTETDWFPIDLDNITPYLQFTAQTVTKGTSFEGNFVYLRVKVDRAYLGAASYDVALHGAIDKVVILI